VWLAAAGCSSTESAAPVAADVAAADVAADTRVANPPDASADDVADAAPGDPGTVDTETEGAETDSGSADTCLTDTVTPDIAAPDDITEPDAGSVPPLTETVDAGACGMAAPIVCGETLLGHTTQASTGQVVDGTSCNEFFYPNAEVVLVFEAPGTGIVDFGLSTGGSTLDLHILKGGAAGCDPLECAAWGPSTGAGAAVVSGDLLYLVVDGYLGAAGGFELSVDCSGLDIKPAECVPQATLECGSNVLVKPADPGLAQQVSEWDGCTTQPGPERAFTFTAAVSGPVTVSATGVSAIVILEAEIGCQADACFEWGSESVVFDALEGRSYHLVLDTQESFADSASVSVSCP
jgi:hypothetical protein